MIKKFICILLLIALCVLLTACGLHSDEDNPILDIHENAAFDGKLDDTTNSIGDEDSFIFTWMTYGEINVTDSLKEKAAYEMHIEGLLTNMKKVGVTDCFVQVRPFADAMYPSECFPISLYAKKAQNFDPLEVIISLAESYKINIHAWINPYRISSGGTETLDKDSEFYSWYKENSNEDITVTSSGVYFNPCSLKVQKLILSGVDELLRNYNIKGIHIDDYFYPAGFGDNDKKQYEAYKKNGGQKDISSWRRENVNSLVSAIYLKIKSYGEDKIFSVSPCGDISKNYNDLYADIYSWCKGGYCDIVLPQIYFGFENEALPFKDCFNDWLSITDSEKVTLIPALALYKSGKEDEFAGKGKAEWQENSDIISRQVKLIKDSGCGGFGLYSSSYINFSETFTADELNNLKSVL